MTEEIYAEDEIRKLLEVLEKYISVGYWVNNTVIRYPNLEHPCEKLEYCPYGQLVEVFPLNSWEKEARKAAKAEGLKLRKYLDKHPEIEAKDCGVFGHECPVHYHAEFAEKTKE